MNDSIEYNLTKERGSEEARMHINRTPGLTEQMRSSQGHFKSEEEFSDYVRQNLLLSLKELVFRIVDQPKTRPLLKEAFIRGYAEESARLLARYSNPQCETIAVETANKFIGKLGRNYEGLRSFSEDLDELIKSSKPSQQLGNKVDELIKSHLRKLYNVEEINKFPPVFAPRKIIKVYRK